MDAKYCSRCGYALPVVPLVPPSPEKGKRKPATKEERRKKIISVVVAIIAANVGVFVVQKMCTPTFDKVLVRTANEFNKHCPMIVDNLTRLDNVAAMPRNTIMYNYTVNMNASQMDSNIFKATAGPGILNNIRTSPDMKELRDHEVTFIYNYKDKIGSNIFKLRFSPQDYK